MFCGLFKDGQVSHVSEKNEPNEGQDHSDTSKRMSEKDIDRAQSPERSPHNLFGGNGNDDSDMDDETGQSYRTCLRKRKRYENMSVRNRTKVEFIIQDISIIIINCVIYL